MIVIRNSQRCILTQLKNIPRKSAIISFCTSRPSCLLEASKISKRNIMTSSPPEIIQQPLDSLLLNKIDTEQQDFLTKHPTYDGRGILIAILDTGVDPSLPGMLVTTTGERKMVDVIDCSGAGDVDTSVIRSVKDGHIEGLTGRKLKIPENWTCPTGKYHVGMKPIYELYTKGVKSRIMSEKKSDVFEPSQNLSAAEALKMLTEHETEIGGSSDKISDKWVREDLACKVEFLKSMKSTNDVGPVADVVTWHDGDIWRVCIDTSFRGRLGMCKVVGPFKETGEYAYITDKDSVVYTVRVSSDGNLTEIAVPSGAHGSHVAGIAAANYPDNPEKNGLAPGAKIVSLNIGDHRLGSMETGQAMTRAFNFCAELGVDVINMSFGEGTHLPDQGRVIEEARRLIDRKKVIYVCSAGNSGPALTTVGAPGGTTTGVIGIGAYLTAESADTLYGVYKPVSSNIYPWSSRGPCADGKLGVSLCAPAAAFANVPKYCRQSMQMMNGTSMSSPNAAGNIACMLSGLRQEGLQWTPYTVRLALENTAHQLPQTDSFSSGQGMIKINSAFEKLAEIQKQQLFPERLTHFEIKVSDYCIKSKGIYMREPNMTKPTEFSVTVEPVFLNHLENDNTPAITFERQVILQCNSPWVSHPSTFFTVAQAKALIVTVDPLKAPKGASYTEIVGIDAADPSLGPIFRIPITVIVPEVLEDLSKPFVSRLIGTPGAPERRFLQIPRCATSAKISLKSTNKDELDRFTLHTVYLEDETCSRNTETVKLHVPTGTEWSKCITVKGGKTLEVCVVRNWTRGKDPVDVEMNVEFFGVKKPDVIPITHGTTCVPIRIQAAPIKSFDISPEMKLNSLVIPLKPQSSKVEPLGARDVFSTSAMQINRALITYKLNVQKTSEVSLELSGITPFLYESPVDCILFQVFGANKSFVSGSGPYPNRYPHKLEKGEYTIQAQIRHPDEQILNNLKELPLLVHTKLSGKVQVNLSNSAVGATTGSDTKFTGLGLLPNQEMTIYAGSLSDDSIPKTITPTNGSYLTGSFSVFKDSDLSEVDKSRVVYYLAECGNKPSKGLSMVTAKKDRSQNEEMKEAIRDLEVSWVNKLTDQKAAKELFDSCVQKYPEHLPLLQNRVKQIMQIKATEQTGDQISEAIQLCSKILEITKPSDVLQFMSIKQEHADDLLTVEKWIAMTGDDTNKKEATKIVAKFEERKNAIIIALQALASFEQDLKLHKSKENLPNNIRFGAITPLIFGGKSDVILHAKKSAEAGELQGKVDNVDGVIEEELKKIDAKWDGSQFYVKLLVWLSVDDPKAALISVKHAASLGQFGRCAKLLNKVGDELKSNANDSKVVDSTLADVCEEMGWVHLSAHFRNVMLIKNRASFRPF